MRLGLSLSLSSALRPITTDSTALTADSSLVTCDQDDVTADATAIPTPSAAYPDDVEAPVTFAEPTSVYGGTDVTPISSAAGLKSAIENAGALGGMVVYVAGGTYSNVHLSAVDKGTGDPLVIRAADMNNKPRFVGSQASSTNALRLTPGTKGLAFDGIEFEVSNATSDFYRVVSFNSSAGSATFYSIWFRECGFYGSPQAGGYFFAYGIGMSQVGSSADVVNGLSIQRCRFQGLKHGIQHVNVTNLQSCFNTFENLTSDCHQGNGTVGGKVLYNLVLDPRVGNSEHPDFYQIGYTGVDTRGCSNLTIGLNFIAANPEVALTGSLESRRTQGVKIENENMRGEPGNTGKTFGSGSNWAHSNIFIGYNKFFGTDFNAISIGNTPDTNLTIKDNELWHIVDPLTTVGNTFLKVYYTASTVSPSTPGYIPTSGSITGNIAHQIITEQATGLSGQIMATTTFPEMVTDGTARDAAKAAWLAGGRATLIELV